MQQSITVGDVACPIIAITDLSLVCRIPPLIDGRSGMSLAVVVNVDGVNATGRLMLV